MASLNVKDASLANKGFKYISGNAVPTYTYDANGNLTSDLNKNITSIEYNYLNLPMKITFGTPGDNYGELHFVYDATGEKLQKHFYAYDGFDFGGDQVTDYVNGVEYEGYINRIAHTEGAVVRNWFTNTYEQQYVLRDHLGNTRVTFTDANNDGVVTTSDIKQINHYYPFGLNMEGNWQGGANGSNKYGYNEKEWNNDFGLDWNDYGARFYDAAIDRWWNLDPEGESNGQISFSNYHYTFDNPVRFNDPDGKEGEACCGHAIDGIIASATGVVVGYADNLLGTNFRESIGSASYGSGSLRKDFNEGVNIADRGSLAGGVVMVVGGTGKIGRAHV